MTCQTVLDGKYQLIYMTPESLFGNPTWWKMLQSFVYQANLVAVVIDEAHYMHFLVIQLYFIQGEPNFERSLQGFVKSGATKRVCHQINKIRILYGVINSNLFFIQVRRFCVSINSF